MKVRYAGKNQIFLGVLTILMALGVYTDRITKEDISVYQLAFMYNCMHVLLPISKERYEKLK